MSLMVCKECRKTSKFCRCNTKTDFFAACPRCRNPIGNCTCLPAEKVFDSVEIVYKELPEDFTRTDIERHIPPVAVVKKQTTLFDLIADVADLVETTPNDAELGAAVRKLFSQ